jgi:hypothetical protein
MKEASYNEPNCYYFFLVSKTSALFVKNFCFVFFIFSSKYKNINKPYINTKVYSLKYKTSFHIYVTSNHFFKRKTKNTTKNTLTSRVAISFCTSSFILLLCPFLRLYIFSSFLHPTIFFFQKKIHVLIYSLVLSFYLSPHFLFLRA